MANLLDLMNEKDRLAAQNSFKKRMSGDNTFRKEKVSRVAFLLAELSMLYGWEAIVSAKRGYIEVFDEHTGKKRKMPLSMKELAVLVDAGHKVKHSDYMDYARIVCVGTGSAFSKQPEETLRRGMTPFINGVKNNGHRYGINLERPSGIR